MKQYLVAILFCGVAANSVAQSERLWIAGVVTAEKTDAPVTRALVQIQCVEPTRPGDRMFAPRRTANYSTFSDAQGRFRMDVEHPSSCTFAARKPNFRFAASAGSGLPPMTVTKPLEGVQIRMSPLSVISGKVIDQDGEPMDRVRVFIMSERFPDGHRVMQLDRTLDTNDIGEYRGYNLAPGKYFVKAAGQIGGSVSYTGDIPPLNLVREGFAPVYSNGGSLRESAQPVDASAGGEVRVDVRVRVQPAHQIQGRIRGLAPGQPVQFELRSGREDVAPSPVSLNVQAGRFELRGAVDGRYTLRAAQGSLAWAETEVTVRGADVTGADLNLTAGAEIPVLVTGVGFPDSGGELYQDLCRTALYSGWDQEVLSLNGKLVNVPPAEYRVAVRCYPGYALSASWGEQDLLSNPVIVVAGGGVRPPIKVTAMAGGGEVVVTAPKKENLVVMLAPDIGGPGRIVVSPGRGPDLPNQRGEVTRLFSNVPPGGYRAYILPSADVDYRNPEYLRSLNGGVAVQVADGATVTVRLGGGDR